MKREARNEGMQSERRDQESERWVEWRGQNRVEEDERRRRRRACVDFTRWKGPMSFVGCG